MPERSQKGVPEGFLTMAQARDRLGVARATMVRIVRNAGIQTYEDPRDARIKLLKLEDVERLAQPRPRAATEDEQGKAAA